MAPSCFLTSSCADLIEKQILTQWVYGGAYIPFSSRVRLMWPHRSNKESGFWYSICCPSDLPAEECHAGFLGSGLWPGCWQFLKAPG